LKKNEKMRDGIKNIPGFFKNLPERIKNMSKSTRIITALSVVLVTVFLIFIIVFSLPGNRADRALAKGDKLYAEGNYESASAQYTKAIELKNLVKAFKGLVISDSAYDNTKAKSSLNRACESFLNGIASEDIPDAVDILLYAPSVFADDPGTLVSVLESGYESTGNCAELLPALSDAYIQLSESLIDKDLEKASEYDLKAREITGAATGLESGLIEKITAEAYELVSVDKYDEAYGLVNKYRTIYEIDADAIVADTDAAKALYETKIELLGTVYDVMKSYYDSETQPFDSNIFAIEVSGESDSETAESTENSDNTENKENNESSENEGSNDTDEPEEADNTDSTVSIPGMLSFDFSSMFEYDGSENAEILATSFTQNAYIYAPDMKEGFTGLVCGLYPYGEPYDNADGTKGVRYYFYFGEYKDGLRNGYGFSFAESSDNSYVGFEGQWKDDRPNGFGAVYQYNGGSEEVPEYKRVTYGNFDDGIQNGIMSVLISTGETQDILFAGTYEAVNGVGTEVDIQTDNYEILEEIPENQKLIGVIPSVSEGYDIYIKIMQKAKETLSALGF